MKHGGSGPPGDRQRIAQARAKPVDQGAGDAVHDGVGQQKREENAGVFHIRHVELFAQNRGSDGECLTV